MTFLQVSQEVSVCLEMTAALIWPFSTFAESRVQSAFGLRSGFVSNSFPTYSKSKTSPGFAGSFSSATERTTISAYSMLYLSFIPTLMYPEFSASSRSSIRSLTFQCNCKLSCSFSRPTDLMLLTVLELGSPHLPGEIFTKNRRKLVSILSRSRKARAPRKFFVHSCY